MIQQNQTVDGPIAGTPCCYSDAVQHQNLPARQCGSTDACLVAAGRGGNLGKWWVAGHTT